MPLHRINNGEEQKYCYKCSTWKPMNGFGNNKNKSDGLQCECKACRIIGAREWKRANRAKVYATHRKWVVENREYRRETIRDWYRKVKSPDVKHRIGMSIRTGMVKSLHGAKAGQKWESLVGYTLQDLMRHLERRFDDGMTWQNYGTEWHIDHIIPIAAHNYKSHDDIDFKRCWSLKNLQPLWARENMVKHDGLRKPFQPCLHSI